MNPLIATVTYVCGIAGLFYLNRDKSVRTSRALWLPVIYLSIIGSRSAGDWLNMKPPAGTNVQLEGSPLDAAFFGILLLCAMGVLIYRGKKVRILLAANWPLLLYFGYCLISVTWSEHPDVAFKRWIKAIIDVAMAMVVVTDGQPVAAIRRLASRVGFVLLPMSLLFIKYFPALGRTSAPDGEMENTGVTTNKNILGVVLLVVCICTLWHLVGLLRDKAENNRKQRLIAQGILLAFGVVLLRTAHSATSTTCFALSGSLILATNHRAFWGNRRRVRGLSLAILVFSAAAFLFSDQVTSAMGRSSTLSGRTEIWAVLLPFAPNPVLGAGFESFWISSAVEKVWGSLSRAGWWHPEILVTEAHNGYIEVYLNLGWVGLSLIALILVTGYMRAIAAIRRNPSLAGLSLALVMASAVYGITEAGFRMLDPIWTYLLLAIAISSAVLTGVIRQGVATARTVAHQDITNPLASLAATGSGNATAKQLFDRL